MLLSSSLLKRNYFRIYQSEVALTAMAAAAACSSYTGEVTERRGIPAASFVQDVQSYLSQSGLDVNSALAFLQERSVFDFCMMMI